MEFLLERVIVALLPALVQKVSQKPEVYELVKLLDTHQDPAASLKLSICLLSDVGLKILEKPGNAVS